MSAPSPAIQAEINRHNSERTQILQRQARDAARLVELNEIIGRLNPLPAAAPAPVAAPVAAPAAAPVAAAK